MMILVALVAVVFVLGLPLVVVFLAVLGVDADDIADVQRSIELTEEARGLVPSGLPLFDGQRAEATTAAVVRFETKKEQARQALWASRDRRRGSPETYAQPTESTVTHVARTRGAA